MQGILGSTSTRCPGGKRMNFSEHIAVSATVQPLVTCPPPPSSSMLFPKGDHSKSYPLTASGSESRFSGMFNPFYPFWKRLLRVSGSVKNPPSVVLHLSTLASPSENFRCPVSSMSTPKLGLDKYPLQGVQLPGGVSSGASSIFNI